MPESEETENESEPTEIEQVGRLDPVAQLSIPERWEFDIRAGPDAGEAEFTYQRSPHPDFPARKVGESTTIKIINQGRTYEILSDYIERDVWTDDVWRVTQALENCYFCAIDRYQEHDGECKTLFEVVQHDIETRRMETLLKSIENVGDSLAEAVGERYNGVYDLQSATDDELMAIPYVGPKLAQKMKSVAAEDAE